MALLLDAGAFIAVERGDPRAVAYLRRARRLGIPLRTTTAVVAQVWRSGARQARLARLANITREHSLDDGAARRIGLLLGQAGTADVVDGSLVELAQEGDEILTSDPADMIHLARAAGKRIHVTRIRG